MQGLRKHPAHMDMHTQDLHPPSQTGPGHPPLPPLGRARALHTFGTHSHCGPRWFSLHPQRRAGPPTATCPLGSPGGLCAALGGCAQCCRAAAQRHNHRAGGFRLCQAQPMTETARAWRAQGRALATALGGVSPHADVAATLGGGQGDSGCPGIAVAEPAGASGEPPATYSRANEGTPGTAPPARALQPGTRELPSPSAVHTGGTAPPAPPAAAEPRGCPGPAPPAAADAPCVRGGAALPRPREPGRLPR